MDARNGAPVPGALPFFRRSYLLVLTVLAIVYLLVTWVLPFGPLEVPLGLLTLLFAPGYAIGSLALGSKPRWPWSLTFAMVVGLSVAFSAAEGLILLELHRGLPPSVFSVVAFALLVVALAADGRELRPTSPGGIGSLLRRELRLPGHSRRQRAVGYSLLVAIVLVLVAIVYFASVFPHDQPSISLGLSGAGGVGSNLPRSGTVGEVLSVWTYIGNNATPQSLGLTIHSTLVGGTGASGTSVPWILPLSLGANTSANESVTLSPGQSLTVNVSFTFPARGAYIVAFALTTPGGYTLRNASLPIFIA